MEITMKNFWHQLPRILISIAESKFVALDVEMTGISNSVSDPENNKNGQPSREDMYRNGKRIASTFNVFELGLTCVKADGGGCSRPAVANLVDENLSDESYKTETYSFYVSPLLLEEVKEDSAFAKGVDRKLTTSLETLKFMKKEGLRLEKMFDDPVPHLSRKEENEALVRFLNRVKKQTVADHRYNEDKDLDVFRGYVDDEIAAWLHRRREDRPSEIKIHIPLSDSKKRNRVYADIVRVAAKQHLPSWMKCRVWDHGATVRIYREDTAEETEVSSTFRLRIIIEALAAGNFASYVDPTCIIDALSSSYGSMTVEQFCQEVEAKFGKVSSDSSGQSSQPGESGEVGTTAENDNTAWTTPTNDDEATSNSSTQESPDDTWGIPIGYDGNDEETNKVIGDQVLDALGTLECHFQSCPRIVVGHNIFWDLLFLYQTFIDDLPDTSVEFFAKIHKLFACILDTKVMAIHIQPIEGEDPLCDIFERLNVRNRRPYIGWDTAYGFGRASSAHEAGYDSFMTATVLLRLGHKLARESLNERASETESWRKRMRKLYTKGWLIDIKRDPTSFDSDSDLEDGFGEETDSDSGEDMGSVHWEHSAFDPFRNTLRIGPCTNVCLNEQQETHQATCPHGL
ncbi:caf1 family ribonuclease [Colletotrichum sojae]|uniref:Caf1 family ribonuclease n=1 Tax=Colletotrichum sojae TaxID=2175907 RepID=A0A8H6N5J5_9PEZI|nr:caf1 family ribonuclease [Colletotrichum sojae]